MDGTVVIGTELNTKSFDAQIKQLESKLQTLEKSADESNVPEKFRRSAEETRNLNVEIEKTRNQLNGLYEKQKKLNATGFENIKKSIDGVGNSVGKVIKKVTRWGLAIFGVRSAYLAIRQAMSTLSQSDDNLADRVDYIKWALANSIKPIIEWIINAVYTIAKLIAGIIYAFTGYNIFKESGIGDYQKAMAKSSKNAKELRKTLAGFDEMNVLNKDGSTGALGSTLTPNMDLSDIENYGTKVDKIVGNMTDSWMQLGQEMDEALNHPEAFDKAYGDWSMFMQGIVQFFKGVWDVITGFGEFIGGILDMIVGLFTGNFEKVKEGFEWVCKGVWQVFVGLLEMILGLLKTVLGLIWGLIKEAWNVIWGLLSGIATLIYDWVIKPIGDFFEWMFDGIIDGAKWVISGIKSAFNSMVNFVKSYIITPIGNFFSGLWNGIKSGVNGMANAIKSAFNGLVNIIKKPLNFIIDGLNKIIDGLNSLSFDIPDWVPFVGGETWGINIPRIPRLAKGGIINNPGKGVYTGSAISGEAGREFYMPLQDEQMLSLVGEAIGRYISINLTNITELDGRQIARKVDKVRNNNNFVMNR